MSFQITEAFVEQFHNNVMIRLQQKKSRYRDAVTVRTGVKGDRDYFEQVGSTAALKKTSRHSDTPLVSTPHFKRSVTLEDYEWADLIDKEDRVRMLIDPTSSYVKTAHFAMNRAMDDVVRDAMLGNAYEGMSGSTTVAFDTTNNLIADGGTGLTVAKLRTLREMFSLDEVGEEDNEQFYVAVGAAEVTDLLESTEVTSSDYNTIKALVHGEVNQFMGFTFIKSQRLNKTGNIRQCIAWAKSGVGLSIGAEQTTRITERDDKSYSKQVYVSMTLGATRIEDEKVIRVDCDES